MVTDRDHGLWWYLHRALCCVGLHASGLIWGYDRGEDWRDDIVWKPKGWLCMVCGKDWKEKDR